MKGNEEEMVIHNLTEFLGDYPLYKEYEVITNYQRGPEGYTEPFDLHGQTFNYFCPNEKKIKVFELNLTTEYKEYWQNTACSESIPTAFLDKDGRLDFVHYYEGKCTNCKECNVSFLLHVYSKEVIPHEKVVTVWLKPEKDPFYNKRLSIYIEKVGEYPQKEAQVSKEFTKYFDRESCNWYYKAKKMLYENMGIGAFAYYRRIVEKELIHFMTDISNLDNSSSDELKKLIDEYEKTNKVHLLYENTYKHLPPSLQGLGENPLKLLYQQTSKGLHNLSEEECIDASILVDSLLEFTVKKINEEKHEVKAIREQLKKLK